MGKFIYATPADQVEIDDRSLAHLRTVISAKLRRNESFMFTWSHPLSEGSGQSVYWIHPSIPLHFVFSGGRDVGLNRAWLEALVSSSNSVAGLHLVPEPPAPAE